MDFKYFDTDIDSLTLNYQKELFDDGIRLTILICLDYIKFAEKTLVKKTLKREIILIKNYC